MNQQVADTRLRLQYSLRKLLVLMTSIAALLAGWHHFGPWAMIALPFWTGSIAAFVLKPHRWRIGNVFMAGFWLGLFAIICVLILTEYGFIPYNEAI